MNRVTKQSLILFSATLFLGSSMSAGAGILEDVFGVIPKLDEKSPAQYDSYQNVRTYHFDYKTLRPTKNPGKVYYTIEDWYGSWSSKIAEDSASDLDYQGNPLGNGKMPSGGEPYDIEAVYWGMDDDNIYVALITSSPHPGYLDTRFEGDPKFIVAGDIGIDLNQNEKYSSDFGYDYAIDITHEERPLFGDVTSAKKEIGSKLYRTKNSDWYTGTPGGAVAGRGELTNFDPEYGLFDRGSYVGDVTTSYREYKFPGGLQEGLTATYVIEVVVPRKLVDQHLKDSLSDAEAYTHENDLIVADAQPYTKEGSSDLAAQTPVETNVGAGRPVINVSYLMGCRNDYSAE